MMDEKNNLIRLGKTDVKAAADIMAKAFQDYPVSVYFIPDAEKRHKQNPKMYRMGIMSDVVNSEVYAISPRMEGVAIWQYVDKQQKPPKRGFDFTSLWLGLFNSKETNRRRQTFLNHSDDSRARIMPERYWYLRMIGVDPAHQGKGYAGRLLRPMLARADREGLPVFLETQLPKNVTLYEHFGFKVVEEGNIPGSDVHSWAMVREVVNR